MMPSALIKKIVIHKFRGLKKTKLSQLRRVNLIGGSNNIGKTVLLEALLLNCAPTGQNVSLLKRLRGFDTEHDKEFPEYTWDNFFYNQQKQEPITIVCAYDDDREITLSIHCDESKADFESSPEENNVTDLISVSNFETTLKSTLHFNYLIDGKNYPVLALISHAKGITVNTFKVLTPVSYMPPSYQRTNASLAKEYGKAEKRNKADLVLKALQIVDSSIEDIKTSVVGGIHLEVKRQNGHFMPLSLFGDAIKKVTNIVLNLINNKSAVLLIDEIENGIHHTVQQAFWVFLFKLATEFDVQIFATSHSAEMILAFDKVCLMSAHNGAYFELRRNPRTGNIVGTIHEPDVLDYELKHDKAYRGE
ncbi:MAG: AAA family ATPase [Pseudomonadota bacterium]